MIRAFDRKILRVLDANLNRALEGLRVAEEVARFVLEEPDLQRKVKSVRHDVLKLGKAALAAPSGSKGRLEAVIAVRDSEEDVGKSSAHASEVRRSDISALIESNCSRAAESVRVFEEFTKLMPGRARSASWKRLRFRIYSIEQELLTANTRRMTAGRLRHAGLYCIVDRMYLGRRSPASVAREMIEGGAQVIQYRDKSSEDAVFLRACEKVARVCRDGDCLFIVNDRTDVALLVNADGVHLGQDDLPVRDARGILGPAKIIGKSSHSFAQAVKAAGEDIDYLAVGAMFPTRTRENQIVAGIRCLRRVRTHLPQMPIVAIGGIDRKNITQVLAEKPDGICIVSAIQTSPDIRKAVRGFTRLIRKGKA
jgi:thiamine-phosphate pyrophosphorylase